jgi:hypothetical protein
MPDVDGVGDECGLLAVVELVELVLAGGLELAQAQEEQH